MKKVHWVHLHSFLLYLRNVHTWFQGLTLNTEKRIGLQTPKPPLGWPSSYAGKLVFFCSGLSLARLSRYYPCPWSRRRGVAFPLSKSASCKHSCWTCKLHLCKIAGPLVTFQPSSNLHQTEGWTTAVVGVYVVSCVSFKEPYPTAQEAFFLLDVS